MATDLTIGQPQQSVVPIGLDPLQRAELARQRQLVVQNVFGDYMAEGVHYGSPFRNKDGRASKKTLLKPGAEFLAMVFAMYSDFEAISLKEDFDTPLFFYRYKCTMYSQDTGLIMGVGIGSCSSREEKYGYRWVARHEVPDYLDLATLPVRPGSIVEATFAVDKAETTGKWGKPASYWDGIKKAIDEGRAKKIQRTSKSGKPYEAWEIDAAQYRIPYIDVASMVNTIDKMAQKRALVAAVLNATGASWLFTQDVEDMPDFTIDGEFTSTPVEVASPPLKPREKPAAWDLNGVRRNIEVKGLTVDEVLKHWGLVVIQDIEARFGSDKEKFKTALEALATKPAGQPAASKPPVDDNPDDLLLTRTITTGFIILQRRKDLKYQVRVPMGEGNWGYGFARQLWRDAGYPVAEWPEAEEKHRAEVRVDLDVLARVTFTKKSEDATYWKIESVERLEGSRELRFFEKIDVKIENRSSGDTWPACAVMQLHLRDGGDPIEAHINLVEWDQRFPVKVKYLRHEGSYSSELNPGLAQLVLTVEADGRISNAVLDDGEDW